ncbi:hypothetical protein KKF61_05070, partial [Patescibacteria group bacterium]|nr:hypothetical protein [Patescibacteria group bacterium]
MTKRKVIVLKKQCSTEIVPKAPYNFDKTVYDPSHFPTPIEIWKPGKFWKTMRFKDRILGIKFMDVGTISKPKIKLTVFSASELKKEFIRDLIKDINFRYGFNEDLSDFHRQYKSDSLLRPVFKRMRGAHSRSFESLYEIIMISIVLQNAIVRRTVQMMNNLLNKYGQKIKFNGKEMYLVWKPNKLAKVDEKELRNLKVGYRAKMFTKISEQFAKGDVNEYRLREMSLEQVERELLKLYGVGPASLDSLLGILRIHQPIRTISPWEQKIYSRLLFNKVIVSPDKILRELKRRYGKWSVFAGYIL